MTNLLNENNYGLFFKLIFLGLLDAIGIWASVLLYFQGAYGFIVALLLGAATINYVFLSDRTYPIRYMVPGLIFLFAFVVYPIGYTFYLSTTNYGTGHILSKQQAIESLKGQYYQPEDPVSYSFEAYKNNQGDIKLILQSNTGDKTYLTGGEKLTEVNLGNERFVDSDEDGTIESFGDYELMSRTEVIGVLQKLQKWKPEANGVALQMSNLTTFDQRISRYEYLEERDRIRDRQTGELFRPEEGTFVSTTTDRSLEPGYKATVGLENFSRIFTDPMITGPFLRVFTWTFIWAFMSVLTTFVLGLGIAIILNDSRLRLKPLYKGLLILPYAIPAFISALIWRGFFNTNVGIINTKLLQPLLGLSPAWFQDPLLAKVAVLIVNLWLGFPYMMVVCLGALQSIQPELYEVAKVDGASPFQQFRKITLPLLMVSVGPLLIGSFAFNFNNFNIIFLVTRGEPPIVGATTAGSTDILISYTYKLAFGGQGATQYGLAAAISIIIFLIIGTISAINFHYTGALEEMSENV
ncbi:maltose ABC transporter permease MalF [Candidatus Bipolaricaulota bacterium]|nr:maltose ABC transporter permease MalF [Candidatus Bipolaricaulota bacterium]